MFRFGCGRFIVLGQILFDLFPHWTGIDHGTFDRPEQAIGSRCQCGCRGRMRLHFRAPRAKQKPEHAERKPEDTLGAQCRQAAQDGHCGQRDQHQAGPLPEPPRGSDSGGKEPSCMEERDRTEPTAQARGVKTCGGTVGRGAVCFHRS